METWSAASSSYKQARISAAPDGVPAACSGAERPALVAGARARARAHLGALPVASATPKIGSRTMLVRTSTASMRRAATTTLAANARAMSAMPGVKPASPNFSSGPCKKRPGYELSGLADAPLGRSHRAKIGKAKLASAIDMTKEMLVANGMPADYHVGIVPASDTGAFEMAMWSLLGPKPITCVHFESFGGDWFTDITKQLKLTDVKEMKADYGVLPDLPSIDWSTDVVFTYNGTTAGVRCPESWAPPADRKGLALCDATSAVFAMNMPWKSLDAVTFSWQKCLGGEGAHGMLVLSPRAVERLESYEPPWPMPKIFRMTKKGKFAADIFQGSTINTPSMLANEDYLDALGWAKSIGGYAGLVGRANANLAVIEEFVAATPWRAEPPHTRRRAPCRPCSVRHHSSDLHDARVPQVDGVPLGRRPVGALEHVGVPQDHRPRQGPGQDDGRPPREGERRPRRRRVPLGAARLPRLVRPDRRVRGRQEADAVDGVGPRPGQGHVRGGRRGMRAAMGAAAGGSRAGGT